MLNRSAPGNAGLHHTDGMEKVPEGANTVATASLIDLVPLLDALERDHIAV
jgi:hypothetical protein